MALGVFFSPNLQVLRDERDAFTERLGTPSLHLGAQPQPLWGQIDEGDGAIEAVIRPFEESHSIHDRVFGA